MILYYMVCLFLTWPLSSCADDHGLPTDKDMLDQLATASENIAAKQANDSISKRFSVHYENSNGFVPIIPSASSSYEPASPRSGHLDDEDPLNATNAVSARDSDKTRNAKGLEEDLAYSSEARIFLNMPGSLTHRRSFDLQAAESNELELLKVNNDTPAVANYNDFYDNMRRETDDETARQRPKAIGEYAQVRGYGNAYAQVRYNGAHEGTKRTVYQREKVVADNYRSQDTVNYDGHEQSATVGPSSRTSYRINGLPGDNQAIDNVAEPSRTHHRLSRPVVVVDAATSMNKDKAKLSSTQGHSEYKTSRNMDNTFSSETLDAYDYGGAEHSRNLSDESAEYSEHVERPRIKVQKSRRRPASSFTRKPAKEHRVTAERDNTEQRDGKYGSSKLKVPQRYRAKPSETWLNEPSEQSSDESAEDSRGAKKVQQASRHTWSQISPSLEISHSSGIELDQLEKPKLVVPLKVNLVPVANFDHATALGNSQGFDVSNAMLRNHYVTAAPISAFSTTHNLAKNLGSLPDVIVGQSSFQNPTVLLSQAESKTAADSLTANYLPSTVTPLFALTSSLTPVELRNLQSKTSPPIVQQLLVQPQPTIQTFLQTPFRTSPTYQIHVNPHGLQGQNLVNHNLHGVLPTTPTLLSQPDSRLNLVDSHDKKNLLASASFTVAQQKQPTSSYYLQQLTNSQDTVPTIVQPGVSLNALTVNAQQLIPTQQQQQQQQQQLHIHQLDKVKNQLDNTARQHSHHVLAEGMAHLPNVGTKNVEIVNPNMKPNPMDTSVNTFATMHYPVLTTPIPIFSTVSPITAHPVSLQSYVNSLTESGAKLAGKQVDSVELKPAQSHERPVFNPSNFVPNVDILESQNALNNKPINEPMQPSLNLVPLMPGGNFFKPSYTAQNELVMKPKLASDLQKYAEQMFRESLKTMYNSHKWNNDRKQTGRNSSDDSDLAKLRLEVQKLRASLSDDRLREPFDAHQSENKVRVTDAPAKSTKRKPEVLLATLEHLLKSPSPMHIFHDVSRLPHKHKYGELDLHDANFGSQLTEHLTPPRPNFSHKNAAREPKKRPASSRFKNGSRKPMRHSSPSGLEASSSNVDVHVYRGSPLDDPSYGTASRHHFTSFSDAYPGHSSPEILRSLLRELRASSSSNNYDINHPRIHNLLGLMMKNNQLPRSGYFRDRDQLNRYLAGEQHRFPLYDDTLDDYSRRSASHTSGLKRNGYSGKGAA